MISGALALNELLPALTGAVIGVWAGTVVVGAGVIVEKVEVLGQVLHANVHLFKYSIIHQPSEASWWGLLSAITTDDKPIRLDFPIDFPRAPPRC
jgi:hypothetical protein